MPAVFFVLFVSCQNHPFLFPTHFPVCDQYILFRLFRRCKGFIASVRTENNILSPFKRIYQLYAVVHCLPYNNPHFLFSFRQHKEARWSYPAYVDVPCRKNRPKFTLYNPAYMARQHNVDYVDGFPLICGDKGWYFDLPAEKREKGYQKISRENERAFRLICFCIF